MVQKLSKQLLEVIKNLSEEELHALFYVISERLKHFHHTRALQKMRRFMILDRVFFIHNKKRIEGVVSRFNQWTVTATLDNGDRWNVTPNLLTKIKGENPQKAILPKETMEKLKK